MKPTQYRIIETRVLVYRRLLRTLIPGTYMHEQFRIRTLGNIQAMRFLKSEYARRSDSSTSIAA